MIPFVLKGETMNTTASYHLQRSVKTCCSFEETGSIGVGWRLSGTGDNEVQSLSVFGPRGDRFSILVFHRENLPPEYTGNNGRWSLISNSTGRSVYFRLNWAIDAQGSGCTILCGRECIGQPL